MCTELFGPVITIYVYEDKDYSKTLKLVDETSEYALTGAILATDRYAIDEATKALQNSAGNFYVNDKPTGAVVGQQPLVVQELLELMTRLEVRKIYCVGFRHD